jgi:hypothetical protein
MKIIRHILFFLLMAILILPAIQQYTGMIPELPLNGDVKQPKKPDLTVKSWFDASFQENYDDYLEQSIGFRPTLIRINNQIAFTVFDTALANGVIIGKNNYLYEYNYIKAHEGYDFAGYTQIQDQVVKAKQLQDDLEKKGKHFLILFAPGKASYFPEYIPGRYRSTLKRPTNYKSYILKCQEKGIHFMDCNDWFMKAKDTTRYPLFTKAGTHWSLYGVSLVVDSLVKYMEKTANIDMVDFYWDGIEISSDPRDTDNDIAKGMNVLFPISTGKLAYPRNRFNDAPEKVKPNVLVVGDSYYWNIFGSGISARLFGSNTFWYYNKESHNPSWTGAKQVSDLDIVEELQKQDFVILLFTEANLSRFPFGFLDDYMKASTEHISSRIPPEEKEKIIKRIIGELMSSKQTIKLIQDKARVKKITFDEMLRIDAKWIFEQNRSKYLRK